jgi:DNA-binding transcriptional ArsR family regulator
MSNSIDPDVDQWYMYNPTSDEGFIPVDKVDNNPMRWDKAWGHQLANLLDAGGEDKARVIAVLFRKKDYHNYINLTMSQIAEIAKVSTKTVSRTLKALEDKHFIVRVRNGRIMLSPKVINRGDRSHGMAVLTMWKTENGE